MFIQSCLLPDRPITQQCISPLIDDLSLIFYANSTLQGGEDDSSSSDDDDDMISSTVGTVRSDLGWDYPTITGKMAGNCENLSEKGRSGMMMTWYPSLLALSDPISAGIIPPSQVGWLGNVETLEGGGG